jgi:hypothetical protein
MKHRMRLRVCGLLRFIALLAFFLLVLWLTRDGRSA